ncbi:hypothetical protein KO488_01700 [Poseidonibacter lekithochrous]|uniref:hypothetical protein n=1 Tax=Poseidonibacter TaxID=2321187 RepID=UPI001C09CBAA|nr:MULTISPECIES: hypothetical protein [Poseidonibacter]MBU3013454.1 hypothetical protein [Poseidonibacter lekithochrous]MDO6826751.1 hypothetical protein [Poseidonibacter sp. 1_MG-2023]
MKLILFLFIFTSIIQAKIVIVTNKNSDISSLSKESIKYLYLAKVNKINNIKIKPLLSKNKELHKRFINNIIDKDILQYSSYWARLVFTGREPIPRRLSSEEIKQKLNEKNTIIYIDKKNINKNWKIIYEK